jgi:hypothetical protein
MACLTSNFAELQATCTATLSTKAIILAQACQWDILSLCTDYILDPMRAGVCLFENYGSISTKCRREIDYTVGLLIPCGKEVGDFCADKSTFSDVKNCLENNVNMEKSLCTQAIEDFEQCQIDPTKSCFASIFNNNSPGGGDGGGDGGGSGGEKGTDKGASNGSVDEGGPRRGPNPLFFLACKWSCRVN